MAKSKPLPKPVKFGNPVHRELVIEKLILAPETQQRVTLNVEAMSHYRDLFDDGIKFDDVVVFGPTPEKTFVVADGHQRITAALASGRFKHGCQVYAGGLEDAIIYSVQEANQRHGVPLTKADRHKATLTLLNHPKWGKMPADWIARTAHVRKAFVLDLRRQNAEAKGEPAPPSRKASKVKAETPSIFPTPAPEPVAAVKAPSMPAVVVPAKDRYGRTIPDAIAKAFTWITTGEILSRRLQENVPDVLAFRKSPAGSIPMAATLASDLEKLAGDIRKLSDVCVCPDCDGTSPHTCKTCTGHGWLNVNGVEKLSKPMQKKLVALTEQ